jgi:hypothetical protein
MTFRLSTLHHMTDAPETVSSTFTVQSLTRRDVWLRDRSTGLTAAIVRRTPDYASHLQEAIDDLSPDEQITATLEAQNSLCTEWHFLELDRL